jgi:fructokinase
LAYTVIAFGELLWDLLPHGPMLGGAPFNFGFRITELSDRGVPVSRLGRDENGIEAARLAADLGVETTYLQWDDRLPTGTVRVSFDSHGNPDYFIVPDVAYDAIELTAELEELGRSADCICFGTLIQRSPRSRDTLYRLLEEAPKALKFLDLNLRKNCHTPETVRASLERADVVKLNEHELEQTALMLGRPIGSIQVDAERLLGEWRLRAVLVTLGERGLFALSADGEIAYEPGYRVVLADAVGAGDACSAAFLHAFLRGQGLLEACRLANLLGAIVASRPGGTAPVSAQDIQRLREDPPERNCIDELAALIRL